MRSLLIASFVCFTTAVAAAGSVTVTGAPNASLEALAGSPTLVTVVLKDSGAEDPNLRVVGVESNYFTVLTSKGDRIPYLYELVSEVRVQGGAIEKPKADFSNTRALRPEDQQILADAWARAAEIFNISNDDQERKTRAAILMALGGNPDAKAYLQQLSETNDLKVAVSSSVALYLVGADVQEKVVKEGLRSGNRAIRGQAATLAGLTNYVDAVPQLIKMSQDRVADYGPASVLALARLDQKSIVPNLLGMIRENNRTRAVAAIQALKMLGGDDLQEQLEYIIGESKGMERFHAILALHEVAPESAKPLLQAMVTEVPTLAHEAALVLATEGDWEGTQLLRNRLGRREDPTEENLVFKARMATALFLGGDPAALAIYQELLRHDMVAPKLEAFERMIEIGDRRSFTMIQSSILSTNNEVALGACNVAAALADPAYRERLLAVRLAGHDF